MGYGELKGFKDNFGYGGLAPTWCKSLYAQVGDSSVTLTWIDPDDTVIGNYLLASWKRTTIVKKKSSYPTSITDGEKVVVETTKNQYRTAGYVDSTFSSGSPSDWYYMAFPESDAGAVSTNTKNHFPTTRIYGFKIAKSNSSPYDRVTYTDDAEGMTPAYMDFEEGAFNYGSWEGAFFMPRPCMLKYDGTVDYYLDPDDFTKKVDGTASDITDESYEGNVMIEFPTVWLYHYNDGTYDYCKISSVQINSSYKAYAHTDSAGNIMPYTYVAAYDGSYISSKMRSLSGKTPGNTQTSSTERTYAQANNLTGSTIWQKGTLADRIMINDLLVLIGKSTNTQAVFGEGYTTGGSSASSLHATGQLNDKGMFWGTNANTITNVKVFGIENYWGNLWKRIEGWIYNGTQYVKLTYGTDDGSTVTGYSDSASGYLNAGVGCGGTSGGYISASQMTNYGYLPVTASGSATTYDADGLWYNASQTNIARVGGNCASGSLCGAFCSGLDTAASFSSWNSGAALSCKPLV